jgi:16S rRNA (uracil1498-N3)-methyltransferase
MTRPRLFVTNNLGPGEAIVLGTLQSHYLLHVLRLRQGAEVLAFNGREGEWRAVIGALRKSGCEIEVKEQVRTQSKGQDIHYVFAPLKQARLDYMVQKAVELGASLLQPVVTDHTAVFRVNMDRMTANAIEAAEQCGILAVPNVAPPLKLGAFLEACERERTIVFCDESAPVASPLPALAAIEGRKIAALIGPEGGFSANERKKLLSMENVCPLSLGPRVMRADTAAVAVLSLINAVLGDWR